MEVSLTRFFAFAFLSLSTLFISSRASSADAPLSVKDATRYCEKAVAEFCVSNNCNAYCNASSAGHRQHEAILLSCKKECTTSQLCLPKPLSTSANPLDSLTREELFQCIAEKRDPEGKISGRRMISWKAVQTPSWTNFLERAKTK